ncbi:MAG: diacylglycerol kinase family protein [Candidatus Obscuribacter sp.]|nr:diacylglycerol kinase family protein [Candidatus Obscuribacter sp.]MBP6595525.1 diacylglycerol kinase family protein [Candidatus Obscuribacter sp.]MBP7577706.1 diacylglycerol kinase family protein [Candidatus Obscuribacter sp.]
MAKDGSLTDSQASSEAHPDDAMAASDKPWDHKCTRASSVFESFYHAFNGVKIALATQRNLRIHFAITPLVLALAFIFGVEPWGFALLILAIGLVIATELINTAIEHLVDIQANYQYHLSARYAKDTAAAAVMLSAFTAAVVGVVVFGPRFFAIAKAYFKF